jgi:hypothetical protein
MSDGSKCPRCPTCGRQVSAPGALSTTGVPGADRAAAALFPFCSERCRLIDLGKWLDGEYRIPCEMTDEEDRG